MRRVIPVLVVAAAVLATAGGALAGKGDPQRAITKADQARAKAMLLRRTDLGAGFTATAPGPDPDWYCAAIDESKLTVTGDAESPDFTRQAAPAFLSVGSTATLYRTRAQALTSWRQGTSAAGERCGRQLFERELGSSGMRLRRFERMAFPKLAPLTIAYRLVVEVNDLPGAPPLYGDLVVLQRGRAQASVVAIALGAPLARPELVALARTVAQRQAKAMAG